MQPLSDCRAGVAQGTAPSSRYRNFRLWREVVPV
ncbi:hypothetical protein FHS44_007944 [Streptosporangium saharense]|uniref:Uncharacterized protein n=1 Tax=Streptosporangium saharense TaxID=1706840 RepID=A0A7W7QVZ9_9ACTN|nr:hypothetical protein [Streptosporangium saharense]